jgi:hypothetical protein
LKVLCSSESELKTKLFNHMYIDIMKFSSSLAARLLIFRCIMPKSVESKMSVLPCQFSQL